MTPDRRPLRLNFWMTVCVVPALMLLIGLGVWQLQRLEWKEGLIAERTAQLALPAVQLSRVPADGWQAFELRHVEVRGRFLHDRSVEIVSRTLRGRAGVHIVTPLVLSDGSGTVLVNRGWAPPPGERRADEMWLPDGAVRLEGVLRAGGKTSAWVPDNEPANDIWFFADPAAMAAATGLEDARPYIIEAAADEGDSRFPVGGQTVTAVRNDHLQYAITWFSLAAVLVAIFVLYHVRRRS